MRKIFIVVAGGNIAAQRHFEDTIQQKRSIKEVEKYLDSDQLDNLRNIYHGSDFIVWGAIPGSSNETYWERMEPGDVVLITNSGRVRYAGEVAAKTRNRELARYFWREDADKQTWELMYFIVNEQLVDVPIEKLNPLFGYKENYRPQGFIQIDSKKVEEFARRYGDILGVLQALERGEDILPAVRPEVEQGAVVEEKIAKAPTEHDEMQWRLIRLGEKAHLDVWVPPADQGREFEGNSFRDHVIKEFHDTLDVPRSIKNIDVVWKFGPFSIKSAFEIEHSTSIYSGILRLSDLRAETPNSVYPLFIVADRSRRRKVLEELKRPTFSSPGLKLDEVIRYISYDAVREVDKNLEQETEFDPELILSAGESP